MIPFTVPVGVFQVLLDFQLPILHTVQQIWAETENSLRINT